MSLVTGDLRSIFGYEQRARLFHRLGVGATLNWALSHSLTQDVDCGGKTQCYGVHSTRMMVTLWLIKFSI
jgi:hypothetical protein